MQSCSWEEGSVVGGRLLAYAQDARKSLIREESLCQHARNPYCPWEKRNCRNQEETNPIFLSIRYSTCHWCHVMGRVFEDESFPV